MNKIKAKLNISEEELIKRMTSEKYNLYIGEERVRDLTREKAMELMRTVQIKAIAAHTGTFDTTLLAYDVSKKSKKSILEQELYSSLHRISEDLFDEGSGTSCIASEELERLTDFFANYPEFLKEEPVGIFFKLVEQLGEAFEDCKVTLATKYYDVAYKLYEEFYGPGED